MDETKLELKVGALVLLAIGGALTLLWLMGELSFGAGNTLTVDFSHTGNVVKGAPVKIGGVSGLTHTVDGVLTDNRDDIRQLLKEMSEAAKELHTLSSAARAQLEPGGKAAVLVDDAAVLAKQMKTDLPVISKQAQTALS